MKTALVLLIIISAIVFLGCISTTNSTSDTKTPTPTPYVPKFHVGDPLTHMGRSIYGGNITSITSEKYMLDSGYSVSISVADSQWSNTTNGIPPKYKVGDYVYLLDNPNERGHITEVSLDGGYYTFNNILDNSSGTWAIRESNKNTAKVPTNYTLRFKSGDYVYVPKTMEYEQILSYSQSNETYTTTKGKFFVIDERYKKLDLNNPPNGLYLFKDENTVLRYIYDEFTQKGFYVIQNPKTGDVVKVSEPERRVIVSQSSGNKRDSGINPILPFIGGLIIGRGMS